LVHPSLPPEGIMSWNWAYRLQFAACFTIAHLDRGWKKTLRQRILLSLLRGPMDWITDAAALALSQVYLECPESRAEIKEALRVQIRHLPSEGYCCYEQPLYTAYLRIPDLDADEARDVRRKLNP
jgi:hypothetical protein